MGLLGDIGGFIGARKDRKSATRAERNTDKELARVYGRAEDVLRGFLPEIQERSGVASNALLSLLQDFQGGGYSLSPGVREAIDRESMAAKEMAAAGGLSQSGGLQGELEKIRTGMILDDSHRRHGRNINTLSALTPFATEGQNLLRDIENLNLDLAMNRAINRGSRLGSNPKVGSHSGQYKAMGNALQSAAQFGANLLTPGG